MVGSWDGGVERRFVGVGVLWAVLVGGLALIASPPVGAAEPVGGGDSPVGAPALWCTSSQRVSVSHLGIQQWSPEAFVGVWVPAGARLVATVEGRVHTQFGWGSDHGSYRPTFRAFDGVSGDPLVDSTAGLVSVGSAGEQWVEIDPYVMYAGYQNHGSSGRVVSMSVRSERASQGLGFEWSVTFSLTDPSGDPVESVGAPACPTGDFDDSETAGPNPAMVDQCGTSRGVADPVDTRTGSINFPLPGVGVAGRGAGLGFGVAYNSSAAWSDSVVGFGWSSVLGMKVAAAGADRVVTQEGGSTVRFGPDGSGGWVAPGRFRASLAAVPGGGWVFTRNHFEVFRLNSPWSCGGVGGSVRQRDGGFS